MNSQKLQPRESLNKAFLKINPFRNDIETFKKHLKNLIAKINESESEEFHKNLIADFLNNTYYSYNHFINTKGRNDLVIHNAQDPKTSVGVILKVKNLEVKKPTNKSEMLKVDNLNTKAFQELVLYFLRERLTEKNLELKYLIATNIYEWFIFDAQDFDKFFQENKTLVQQFKDFTDGRLTSKKPDFFYQEIAQPAITEIADKITFTHFDIREYQEYLQPGENPDDHKLIPLFKLLSPEHLLKLPFADSNTLDKGFYHELLHIIGLTEVKKGGKKLIQRKKENERNTGSLMENTIIQLDSLDKISQLKDYQLQLFNFGLELAITWVNRILFLKLLEAQLIKYHQNDQSWGFLNLNKVQNYDDLNSLFFSVLARKPEDRNDSFKNKFAHVPYLNSSLFEPTEMEQATIFISNLRNEKLEIFPATVLKDNNGKKRFGEINALEYLFEFLDAYDFSSETGEEIQEENKRLINASVLGLIFEKINGYQDGSFFTPGFITMYMCRETIRRAVVQKFNEIKGWNCENIDDLYDKIEDKKDANTIINSLKICDPAVGSGHFLVSALNEIIAIKSELKILLDREGKRLKQYQIEVVNDELIVIDEDGLLFEYNPKSQESQRVQETLFHEKQRIIEGCLFGVDINSNSVKICQLRLWVELLKNAYYKTSPLTPLLQGQTSPLTPLLQGEGNMRELETLPNIDINIKCGNSLISRFALDSDLRPALNRSKYSIESYRNAVKTYRNAENKEQKREMKKMIADIKGNFKTTLGLSDVNKTKLRRLEGEVENLQGQIFLIPETKAERTKREKKIAKLNNEIDKLRVEIEKIENGRMYENALEWRFEFPEVLNNDGVFVGFDVVIGNPPYIRQEEIKELKPILQQRYQCYTGTADIFVYFYEIGLHLLKSKGNLTYISSNKYFRAGYGEKLRQLLTNSTTIYNLIDFGDFPVFEEAIAYPSIITLSKVKPEHNQVQILSWNTTKKEKIAEFVTVLKKEGLIILQKNLQSDGWRLESSQILDLLTKLQNSGTPLEEYVNGQFYRGILTGFNEAFVIDRETRDRLIAEDPSSAEVIKPLLRGRDVKRWYVEYQDLYLLFIPWHFPLHQDSKIIGASDQAEKEFENRYPSIYNHLLKFKTELSARNKSETGIRYEWYALQRYGSNYWQEFEQPKIIYPNICKRNEFAWDESGYYTNQKAFIIPCNDKVLLAVLNSSVVMFLFQQLLSKLQGAFYEPSSIFMKDFPIPTATESQRQEIENLVQKCLDANGKNVKNIETEIDQLVYQLYELTPEEIKIIEG